MVIGTAHADLRRHARPSEQEVLSCAADILIDPYAGESARAAGAAGASRAALPRPLHEAAARVFVHDAALRVEARQRRALAAMAEGDSSGRCWRRCAAC